MRALTLCSTVIEEDGPGSMARRMLHLTALGAHSVQPLKPRSAHTAGWMAGWLAGSARLGSRAQPLLPNHVRRSTVTESTGIRASVQKLVLVHVEMSCSSGPRIFFAGRCRSNYWNSDKAETREGREGKREKGEEPRFRVWGYGQRETEQYTHTYPPSHHHDIPARECIC
ncbi:hypothetical protein BKA80DRAFT_137758 [Phyllosticta citrichinensis]